LAAKFTPTITISPHRGRDVGSDVEVTGVRSTYVHPFATSIAITHDDGNTFGVILIAQSRPADSIGMIEIIVLDAIGIVTAGVEESIDSSPNRCEY
jgi:hypothetical protein